MKARIRLQLTKAEQKALYAEADRQAANYEKKHGVENMARSLWVLHACFGFGEKRLRQFYKAYTVEIDELVKHYELHDTDDVWICTQKLKDAGFDVGSWKGTNNDSQRIS